MRPVWTSLLCLALLACGESGEQAVKDAWSQQFMVWIGQLETGAKKSRHRDDLQYLLNQGLYDADEGLFGITDLGAFKVEFERSLEDGEVDLSRRITSYIDPFPDEYVEVLLDGPAPQSLESLVDTYLDFNPTRNRALDMLPLFKFVLPERVGRKIAHSDLGPTGRRVLVKSMALVAAASGDLDDRELAFYTQCLRAFGRLKPQHPAEYAADALPGADLRIG